jgi:hypothetical protein
MDQLEGLQTILEITVMMLTLSLEHPLLGLVVGIAVIIAQVLEHRQDNEDCP